MCRHLMDNPDHKVDFAKPNILSSSGDSARLLILESLKNMSHCLTLTPNPLLFTYLIVNLTPSVFLLVFGLLRYNYTTYFDRCLGYAITCS